MRPRLSEPLCGCGGTTRTGSLLMYGEGGRRPDDGPPGLRVVAPGVYFVLFPWGGRAGARGGRGGGGGGAGAAGEREVCTEAAGGAGADGPDSEVRVASAPARSRRRAE